MFKKIMLGSVDLTNIPDKFMWYTVVTKCNYEDKYIKNVKQSIKGTKLEKSIQEFYIPVKYSKETTTRNSELKTIIHRISGCFSNYVFVKCLMTEELWNLLRTTTGAAVILSTGGIPSYLSDNEITSVKLQQCPEGFSDAELQELENKNKQKYVLF